MKKQSMPFVSIRIITSLVLVLLLTSGLSVGSAQVEEPVVENAVEPGDESTKEPIEEILEVNPALLDWQAMRFGMFIHWGPVNLKGTEIGWSCGDQVPADDYDKLYKRFEPVRFKAKEWAALAKDAGMRYLVITAKHHDGFCLWDSAYTDYDIMNLAYKRDVLKELSEACRAEGILFSSTTRCVTGTTPTTPRTVPAAARRKPTTTCRATSST